MVALISLLAHGPRHHHHDSTQSLQCSHSVAMCPKGREIHLDARSLPCLLQKVSFAPVFICLLAQGVTIMHLLFTTPRRCQPSSRRMPACAPVSGSATLIMVQMLTATLIMVQMLTCPSRSTTQVTRVHPLQRIHSRTHYEQTAKSRNECWLQVFWAVGSGSAGVFEA